MTTIGRRTATVDTGVMAAKPRPRMGRMTGATSIAPMTMGAKSIRIPRPAIMAASTVITA